MDDNKEELNADIKKYASNAHRMSFLLDPVEMEMYVDYGNDVTIDEMTEAGIQVITNILDHLPDDRQNEAASEIINEIKQYLINRHAQA